MRTSQLVIVAVWSLSLGALAGACSPENVPNNPTYEDDVRPILESRCIRCHGAGGTLNTDPDHTGLVKGGAPFNGYFNQLGEDCPNDGGPPGSCHGLLWYTVATFPPNGADLLTKYIRSTDDNMRMPPPPTPPLTTRQLDVFNKWLAKCTAAAQAGAMGSCP